jgi:hypothetical protein
MEFTGGSLDADHLCVLVHGVRMNNNHLLAFGSILVALLLTSDSCAQLWGNPRHMNSVAKALRAEHPEDKLYL